MNKDEKERLRRMVKERERCREILSNAHGIREISASLFLDGGAR